MTEDSRGFSAPENSVLVSMWLPVVHVEASLDKKDSVPHEHGRDR
jgi:hypothetical protein